MGSTADHGDRRRVLDAATALAGGDADRAIQWFEHERLKPFDGFTASELVRAGRADDVLKFMESLEAGPAG